MRDRMKVYLTFDIEIWCNDWSQLDKRFPAAYERYVYGHSTKGEYALPKTLEILDHYGLKGIFFIEPLFAARFGIKYLQTIVNLIKEKKHDIQLHLHPEWTDEIRPLLFSGATHKRQHLRYYTLEEQAILIQHGLELLSNVGCTRINAFRAGSFACNADTFVALHQCGISVDCSLNQINPESAPELRDRIDFTQAFVSEGLTFLPLTVFRDGMGRVRHAQIGSCSFAELSAALNSAYDNGSNHFTLLSHNFEMLKQKSNYPDMIVAARFEALCRYLSENQDRFSVAVFDTLPIIPQSVLPIPIPSTPLSATLWRHGEQLVRRMIS